MNLKKGLVAALAALTITVVGGLLVLPARAQLPIPLPTSTSEPQPDPSPSPSPTGEGSTDPSPDPGSGGTQPGGNSTKPPPAQPQPASGPGGAAGSSVPPLSIPNIARSPSQTTSKLLEILGPVADRGIPLEQVIAQAAAPFPVAGQAWFTHDWGFPRYVPYPHLHEGTDIFADFGTPIVASGPGVVAGMGNTSIGGISAWVAGDDGSGFYYTHMQGLAEGLHVGQRVEMGTVIGYVGNTGNAITTPPHLHFEVHPPIKDAKGRIVASGVTTLPNGLGRTNTPPTDPKPYLDQWLRDAEQRAVVFVQEFIQRYAGLSRQIHFSRRVDQMFTTDSVDRPGDLVWLSVMEPTLGVLGLARDLAADSGLLQASGSFTQRTAEEQRIAAIQLAIQAKKLKFLAITGGLVPEEQHVGGHG